MTYAELTSSISLVCPIFGVGNNADGSTRIDFQPSATQQQIAAANSIASGANLNGQPARIPLDALAIFQYVKPGGTGALTQAQQLQIALACSSVVLAQNPALAARINQALGLNIPFDQVNPNG